MRLFLGLCNFSHSVHGARYLSADTRETGETSSTKAHLIAGCLRRRGDKAARREFPLRAGFLSDIHSLGAAAVYLSLDRPKILFSTFPPSTFNCRSTHPYPSGFRYPSQAVTPGSYPRQTPHFEMEDIIMQDVVDHNGVATRVYRKLSPETKREYQMKYIIEGEEDPKSLHHYHEQEVVKEFDRAAQPDTNLWPCHELREVMAVVADDTLAIGEDGEPESKLANLLFTKTDGAKFLVTGRLVVDVDRDSKHRKWSISARLDMQLIQPSANIPWQRIQGPERRIHHSCVS